MPFVGTALGVLGGQDAAWSEAGLTRPRHAHLPTWLARR